MENVFIIFKNGRVMGQHVYQTLEDAQHFVIYDAKNENEDNDDQLEPLEEVDPYLYARAATESIQYPPVAYAIVKTAVFDWS